MIKYEDDCVGCPSEMGCMGSGCKYNNVPHYYCDHCNTEYASEELREYEGEWICKNCYLDIASEEWFSLEEIDTDE